MADDTGEEFPVDAPETPPDADEGPGDFIYDEDLENLVESFMAHPVGVKALDDIGAQVRDDFDGAWEANEEYRERVAQDWRTFTGDLKPKDFPWKDAANQNVPIMLQNTIRIHSRLKKELFGDWSETFRYLPLSPAHWQHAEALTIHDNWQFRSQIPDFKRQQDRGLLTFIVGGDVTCHSYYDQDKEQNRHEILTSDEFVTPYVFVSTMPDYSDVPFRVKILFRYKHEIQKMRGVWHGVDELIAKGEDNDPDGEPEQLLRASTAEMQGQKPDDSGRHPRKILLYEGWLELPGQPDARFCQVHYDYESETVLQLRVHEKEDWRDRLRFDREVAEMRQYQQAAQQHEQATMMYPQVLQEYESAAFTAGQAAASMGMPLEQGEAIIPPRPEPPGPPPVPPAWSRERPDGQPRPVKMVPIHMFAHGVCIENLTGTLGLGYGRVQADLNRSANTAMNQFTDSATLGNSWHVVHTDAVRLPRPWRIKPGGVTQVDGISGEELKQNLIEMRPAPANPQMMDIVERNYAWGESSMSAPGVFSGEPGKSGETWRGQAGRVEQATAQISVVAQTYAQFYRQIIRNNAELNALFLPDEQLIAVTHRGEPRELQIGRGLYRQGYEVEIASDLRFVPQSQKVMEATEITQMVGAYPPLAGNFAMAHAALKNFFEVSGNHKFVPLLGPAPPPPQVPMGTPPPAQPGMPPGAPPQGGPPQAGPPQPPPANKPN